MSRSNDRWPSTLRELDLFADCDDAELGRIASLITQVSVDAGKDLMGEGNRDRQFMVIAQGHAVVISGTDHQRLADIGPGSFVGEMSLLDDVPRSATVTAVTPLTLYACNEQEFFALLAAAPSVGAKITRTASERREMRKAG
jgi:CRP/FNR family transcriptional regulator, cyclic AMP receptor protein